MAGIRFSTPATPAHAGTLKARACGPFSLLVREAMNPVRGRQLGEDAPFQHDRAAIVAPAWPIGRSAGYPREG
jgi:hypothetical protein